MKEKIDANTIRTTDKLIVLSENRSKITFVNDGQVEIRKIKIDGGVITEGERCDWLIIPPSNIEYFVELKGADVKKAFDQLKRSIGLCCVDKNGVMYAFIISTKCPLNDSQLSNLKKKMRRVYSSCTLERQKPHCKYNLITNKFSF